MPEIIYSKKHVSGLPEIGVQYSGGVRYLVLPEKYGKLKKGKTLTDREFEKLKNTQLTGAFNSDCCACCGNTDISVIDRGVPLCAEHEDEQEKRFEKAPPRVQELPVDEYDTKNPYDILFK